MPRSKHLSLRVPHPVMDALEIRRRRGEFGAYQTLSELETGQNVYASFFPREHLFTVELARMPQTDQDAVHDFSLRLAEAGLLLANLTDEKPVTAPTILALARHWTAARLKRLQTPPSTTV